MHCFSLWFLFPFWGHPTRSSVSIIGMRVESKQKLHPSTSENIQLSHFGSRPICRSCYTPWLTGSRRILYHNCDEGVCYPWPGRTVNVSSTKLWDYLFAGINAIQYHFCFDSTFVELRARLWYPDLTLKRTTSRFLSSLFSSQHHFINGFLSSLVLIAHLSSSFFVHQ